MTLYIFVIIGLLLISRRIQQCIILQLCVKRGVYTTEKAAEGNSRKEERGNERKGMGRGRKSEDKQRYENL